MELEYSLIIYFVFLLSLFKFFLYSNYTIFSAFYMAVTFSIIMLLIIHPINSDGLDIINSENILYFTIIGFSGLIFISYSMMMAINDTVK
jgi:hypothetical protein